MSVTPSNGPTDHATALVVSLGGRAHGLLVTGPSGAGKSSLLAALLDRAALAGRFARLVADDRVTLEARGGRLLARAPVALLGRMELRGLGIVAAPCLCAARLHAHVALCDAVERMPDAAFSGWHGVCLPRLAVSCRDPLAAIKVERWLSGNRVEPSAGR